MTKEAIVKKCKKSLKMAAATSLIACGICVSMAAALYAEIKLTVDVNNMLNFQETVYYTNESIEPGYYNKNPMTIAISDKFSNYYKKEILKAIQYVDEVIEGIKFKIVDGENGLADIKISVDTNIKDLGMAYPQTKEIYINNQKFHHLGVKATIIHELAHILGLKHSKDMSSLMYPIVTRLKFSEKDIADLNKIWPAQEDELSK